MLNHSQAVMMEVKYDGFFFQKDRVVFDTSSKKHYSKTKSPALSNSCVMVHLCRDALCCIPQGNFVVPLLQSALCCKVIQKVPLLILQTLTTRLALQYLS